MYVIRELLYIFSPRRSDRAEPRKPNYILYRSFLSPQDEPQATTTNRQRYYIIILYQSETPTETATDSPTGQATELLLYISPDSLLFLSFYVFRLQSFRYSACILILA